ncbi:craniofacial development protein 2 [Biomphalaria pfeifferi]|uniref:Craniofacial development protein 2 n=1 Tax=Biomphalaria pfeifferi TaxID=112525 RepID=A0AAD8BUD7_BIOPF|nr:craniofacial development protein 2 [Biomphalaria pfeifferi]
MIPLKVACCNVRTLQDSNKSEFPQRKSAVVALELARLDVDIATLSEVRLASQGSLTERGMSTLTERGMSTPSADLEKAPMITSNRE